MLMIKLRILLFLLIFFASGCAKNTKENISTIQEKTQELEMISSYNEAYEALNSGDLFFATKKFLESEILYPQSEWAPKAALMASYSYYLQNYYTETITNTERYIKTYPKDDNLAYAHYLIAISYYESIEDEKRDTGPLIKAKKKLEYIIDNYKDTEFATDATFKINFLDDILASKEMYLGRHYIKKGKWIAAINRFKTVITKYDHTIFTEEALHRLVEINYNLGLIEESKKYAKILGYNYQSSDWYEKSYIIFNIEYNNKSNQQINKNTNKILKKFKKLF